MKVNRVINFGCSHAYGSEMGGYRDDTGHYDLNYGNIVAKHLGVNFEIAAVPGASNEYILNAVTEKVQQGDLCLLSWANFRRAMYHRIDDCPEIPSHNFTEYEVITVMDSVARKLSKTSLSFNNTMLKGMFKNENLREMVKHTKKVNDTQKEYSLPFIENINHSLVETIARYNVFYAWEFLPMFIKYLQLYNSVNAIVQNKGAKAINFIFHENKDILRRMELATDCYNELELNVATALYNNWKNDPTRIQHDAPNYWSLNEVACNITGVPEYTFPGDRQGHYGPDEHKVIGDILIKKCKELGCQ